MHSSHLEIEEIEDGGNMYFPSKRDFWPWLILWFLIILSFVVVLINLLWMAIFILLFVMFLQGWCWFKTGYYISDEELKIMSGPYRKVIPLIKITKIKNKKCLYNQPALSWSETLEITYDKNQTIFVSPKKQDEFKKLLKEKCKNIEII
jgi:hypothetical protein